MPYKWVDPEVFIEHGGVVVCHAYKDDFMDRRRDYWFQIHGAVEPVSFDIRSLSGRVDCGNPVGLTGKSLETAARKIIEAAIDANVLTNEGIRPSEEKARDYAERDVREAVQFFLEKPTTFAQRTVEGTMDRLRNLWKEEGT